MEMKDALDRLFLAPDPERLVDLISSRSNDASFDVSEDDFEGSSLAFRFDRLSYGIFGMTKVGRPTYSGGRVEARRGRDDFLASSAWRAKARNSTSARLQSTQAISLS